MKETVDLLSPSEYLLIPIGIFIGFAITSLMQGVIRIYQNWEYIVGPYDKLHAVWSLLLFLGILEYWWASYQSLPYINRNFITFITYCLPSLSAYAVSGILFPMDYNKKFFNNYFSQFMEKRRKGLYIALLFYLGSIFAITVPIQDSFNSSTFPFSITTTTWILNTIRAILIVVVAFGLFINWKYKSEIENIEESSTDTDNNDENNFKIVKYKETGNFQFKSYFDIFILLLTSLVLILFLSVRLVNFKNTSFENKYNSFVCTIRN